MTTYLSYAWIPSRFIMENAAFVFPTSNGGVQKWKLSRSVYTLHSRFCTFGANLHAQSGLVKKNFYVGAQEEVYHERVVGWVDEESLCSI